MKDGRTHLAHKAEHGVDLETGAIVAITIHEATAGDPATLPETLTTAAEQVEAVQPESQGLTEAVADKGYHSNQTLTDLEALGIRTYIAEPDRGRRTWRGKTAARDAVYRNRRRIRGPRGRRLLRQPGERLERPCAHLSHRSSASHPSARACEHPEAARDSCRRRESRVAHQMQNRNMHFAQGS